MTPYIQTILHDHPTLVGNCWQTAIASVLDLELDEVPHFVQMDEDNEGNWWDLSSEWLKERGYDLQPQWEDGYIVDEYYLVTGQSPRGDFDHVVVFQNGKMVHDPHPSGDGILDQKAYATIRPNR